MFTSYALILLRYLPYVKGGDIFKSGSRDADTEETMTTVHIYAPAPVRVWKRRMKCPVCERRTTFVCDAYEWYSGTITCLGCGDSWNEDGRMQRPFKRNWRPEAIAKARKHYNRWRDHATR
jgi:hypothetical protein